MHHDIYVPFAYGAFYNHPLETIPIDGILFPLCLSIAQLDNQQSAIFGAIWTFKTVVDHCGYDFPWNPCNIVCRDSVRFHDLQCVSLFFTSTRLFSLLLFEVANLSVVPATSDGA